MILVVTVEKKTVYFTVSVVEKKLRVASTQKKGFDENHFINLYFLSQLTPSCGTFSFPEMHEFHLFAIMTSPLKTSTKHSSLPRKRGV